MLEALAEILDDLSHHIETEMARVPEPVARALLSEESPFTTVDVLRILAQPEKAADLIGIAPPSKRPTEPPHAS